MLKIKLYSDSMSTRLERQAVVKLTNHADNSVMWQTTDERPESVFTNIPYGSYEIEISAAGYLTAQNQFGVMDFFARCGDFNRPAARSLCGQN